MDRKRIWQILWKTCVVMLLFTLTGCDPGEGRGDWSMDLYSGYDITKVNSRGIVIGNNSGYVIQQYFVTGFQAKEPYVCLRGIPIKDTWISDEELKENKKVYYLLNTDTNVVAGPFATFEELRVHCETVSVIVKDQWIDIDRKSSKPPKIGNTGMVVPVSPMKPWDDRSVGRFKLSDYEYYIGRCVSNESFGPITDLACLLEKTEAFWVRKYGNSLTRKKPYQVFYDEDAGVWLVTGTFYNPAGKTAEILVEHATGDVLAIWHEDT